MVAPRRRVSRSSVVRRGADGGADPGEALVVEPEPGPLAPLLAFEDPGLGELGEMVADRRLGTAAGLGEVARARLAILARRDEREQPEPHRIGECLEESGELVGVGLGERLGLQGSAARDRQRDFHEKHIDIHRYVGQGGNQRTYRPSSK